MNADFTGWAVCVVKGKRTVVFRDEDGRCFVAGGNPSGFDWDDDCVFVRMVDLGD